MNLGFRASGFNIREGSKSTAQLKSTTRVTAPRYPIKKNAVVRKTSSEPSKLVQGVRTTEER